MPPQVIFAPARAGPTEGWVSAPKSWFYLLFVVLVAASLAVWWTPLRLTFALALSDERYTHILLILPVSAGLIYVDWKSRVEFFDSTVGYCGGLFDHCGFCQRSP